MQITANTILGVLEDYLNVLETSQPQDLNKIYLVRDCANALQNETVSGWTSEEVEEKLRNRIDELEDEVEELKTQLEDEDIF